MDRGVLARYPPPSLIFQFSNVSSFNAEKLDSFPFQFEPSLIGTPHFIQLFGNQRYLPRPFGLQSQSREERRHVGTLRKEKRDYFPDSGSE